MHAYVFVQAGCDVSPSMHAVLVLYPMKTMEMQVCVCSVSTRWWCEGPSLWCSEGVGAVHMRECVVRTLFARVLCIMSGTCALMDGWICCTPSCGPHPF